MHFDVLTLFPGMFAGPLTESIIKRAVQAGQISYALHDIRAYATDRHRTTDDAPYGGGAGMVMKAEPLAAAIRAVLASEPTSDQQPTTDDRQLRPEAASDSAQDGAHAADVRRSSEERPPVILLTPDGQLFTQRMAEELARHPRLVLVCGHYEGVDERVREALIDREISIGDYVLTGGELAAMVVIDAVARLVPGVIDHESIAEESHADGLLEYPHYTRPAVWEGRPIPPVLVSGHHAEVAAWRRRERLRRTLERRPDLLARAALTPADRAYLRSLGWPPDEKL
ncbi:MAG TPA: tRNA (guanosine(37)-N1)-methyltransferase TrmD [Roseiflexaceae bacterium]|nr:tRNA (guanosine(37)-N1)-methyltransferase TrmD [Roseiflexaceae bacterium]